MTAEMPQQPEGGQTNGQGPIYVPRDAKISPFACNVCGKNYSRVDHLARHYRSHTREKPFTCTTCNKNFARADLLKRHAAGHSSDGKDARRNHSSPQLTRVAQACTACATAKLRCGNDKPCRRCLHKGIPCTFPPPNEKQRHSSQKAEFIPRITEDTLDLDGLEGAVTLSSMESQARMFSSDAIHTQDQSTPLDLQQGPEIPLQTNDALNGSSLPSSSTAPIEDDSIMDFDDSSLAEFLRDVMMPPSPNSLVDPNQLEFIDQQYCSRDVFNFGMDSSLDFTDMDFGWISSQNMQPANTNFGFNVYPDPIMDQVLDRGQQTPDVNNGINLSAQAFQKSLWLWNPLKKDHSAAEQINLSLPHKDMEPLEMRSGFDILVPRLEQSCRDRILAMLLKTCEPVNVPKVVTSFPSAELLDSLMHLFFKTELSQTDSWIHLPTFRPQFQRPELNGIIIAAGALQSSVPTIRKLGFAIQEAVRLTIPTICEEDNSRTRELQFLQTYALQLAIGLWSGNKRKMEIAESHEQPLITMLKRAGHYRRSRVVPPAPLPDDDDNTLEEKWRRWVEAESFKRLAFHTLIHDAQASISLLIRPLISYAEVSLELPCSQSLWQARNAQAWRKIYLEKFSQNDRLPSLVNCIHDISPLHKVQDLIDLQFSTSIILHSIWTNIADHRQLEFVLKLQAPDRLALISTSWHQELCQRLDHFRITASEWDGGLRPEAVMLQELFMMNLHVSFEELQLFAGKEGNEEAQRVYPLLKQWFDSRKSRQAMFHAGQVIRAALSFPPNHLRDFYAIALYHASLAFWVYGMVSLGSSRSRKRRTTDQGAYTANGGGSSAYDYGNANTAADNELIWLDGENTAETRRFIAIQRGIPVLNDLAGGFVRLDDPRAVMEMIVSVMGRNCPHGKTNVPPLVENLGLLMRDLGNAAWIVSCH